MITIFGMTWKELLRKRVLLLTVFMTLIFLLAFWFVAQTIGEHLDRDNVDPTSISYLVEVYQTGAITLILGFFFGSFVIAFLAIFSSFSSVAGEAEQGVLQAVLPRPLARWRWYLGRWLGYVTMGVSYAAFLFIAILIITYIHSSLPGDTLSLLKSFALFASVVPLLVSVSMLGSCFFSALGNGVFMTMLFGAGWLGGMIEKVTSTMIRLQENTTLRPLHLIAGMMSLIMPADSIQQRMLAELFSLSELQSMVNLSNLGPLGLGQIPSNAFLMYAAGYTLLCLAAGFYRFGRKDF